MCPNNNPPFWFGKFEKCSLSLRWGFPTMASEKSNGDRISVLSDSILHHILSSLDAKDAVRTSVLSSRWRHLWKSMPHFIFDKKITHQNSCFGGFTRQNRNFAGLVYEVLLLRETSDIQTFRLLSIDDTDVRDLYNWIIAAIERNVKEIEIDLLTNNPIQLPNRLFTCQTLTSLELSSSSNIRKLQLPDRISLPNLETLSLNNVSFGRIEAVNQFISSCPILSFLELLGCDLDVEGCLVINSPKLHTLAVKTGDFSRDLQDLHKCKIRVHEPNLEVFLCDDYIKREYTFVEEITHLERAEIYLVVNGKDVFAPLVHDVHLSSSEDGNGEKEHARRCTSLLGAVCSTKRLCLCAWMLLVGFGPRVVLDPQLLQFHNLKNLDVETWLSRDCVFAIFELLRMSPKIENLVLRIIKNGSSGMLLNWNEGIFTSANVVVEIQGFPDQCIFHHLKVIEIHGVIGCMNEFKVLEILLRNSIILEKMVIWTLEEISSDRKKGLINFSKALLRIPRASSGIAILFF